MIGGRLWDEGSAKQHLRIALTCEPRLQHRQTYLRRLLYASFASGTTPARRQFFYDRQRGAVTDMNESLQDRDRQRFVFVRQQSAQSLHRVGANLSVVVGREGCEDVGERLDRRLTYAPVLLQCPDQRFEAFRMCQLPERTCSFSPYADSGTSLVDEGSEEHPGVQGNKGPLHIAESCQQNTGYQRPQQSFFDSLETGQFEFAFDRLCQRVGGKVALFLIEECASQQPCRCLPLAPSAAIRAHERLDRNSEIGKPFRAALQELFGDLAHRAVRTQAIDETVDAFHLSGVQRQRHLRGVVEFVGGGLLPVENRAEVEWVVARRFAHIAPTYPWLVSMV